MASHSALESYSTTGIMASHWTCHSWKRSIQIFRQPALPSKGSDKQGTEFQAIDGRMDAKKGYAWSTWSSKYKNCTQDAVLEKTHSWPTMFAKAFWIICGFFTCLLYGICIYSSNTWKPLKVWKDWSFIQNQTLWIRVISGMCQSIEPCQDRSRIILLRYEMKNILKMRSVWMVQVSLFVHPHFDRFLHVFSSTATSFGTRP